MASLSKSEIIIPPGQVVIRQGEVSRDVFYWSGGGTVLLRVDGKPVRELTYDPEERHYFGDLSAILGIPHGNTVETVSANRFLRLKFEEGMVERMLQGAPALTRNWLRSLALMANHALSDVQVLELKIDKLEEDTATRNVKLDAARRAWAGSLFLTRQAAEQWDDRMVGGLAAYLESLGLFDGQAADPGGLNPAILGPELEKIIL